MIKTESVFIENILDELGRGSLVFPPTPRPFVWQPVDMLALFTSIIKGHPIGTPLLWEKTQDHPGSKVITSRDVTTSFKPNSSTAHAYILDGQQRLLTLWGCLAHDDAPLLSANAEPWWWDVFFDLKNKIFVHARNGRVPITYFPVRALLKTVDFLDASRTIQNEYDDPKSLIKEAELLAQRIRSYRLPINRMKGGTLSQAVEICALLDKPGSSYAPDQIISAFKFNGPNNPNLSHWIDQRLAALENENFGTISRMAILQSIGAIAGVVIHKTMWTGLPKTIDDQLIKTLDKAEKALFAATDFLVNTVGVPGAPLLPYMQQFTLLCAFFDKCAKPNSTQKERLIHWFWATSYSGWFEDVNPVSMKHAIRDMVQFALGESEHFTFMNTQESTRPFPHLFDPRSARVKVLLLRQIACKPLEPNTGQPLDLINLANNTNNWLSLFPLADNLAFHTANRILIPRKLGESPVSLLRNIPHHIRTKVLKSHSISEKAYEHLVAGDDEAFIEARGKTLKKKELHFIMSQGLKTTYPTPGHKKAPA
nr:DUF262 domain-containing protein [Acanthopleuribacter pedis]